VSKQILFICFFGRLDIPAHWWKSSVNINKISLNAHTAEGCSLLPQITRRPPPTRRYCNRLLQQLCGWLISTGFRIFSGFEVTSPHIFALLLSFWLLNMLQEKQFIPASYNIKVNKIAYSRRQAAGLILISHWPAAWRCSFCHWCSIAADLYQHNQKQG